MLEKIRESTKGWFAWILLGALAIVFTLWGVYGYLGVNSAESEMIARVNGRDIPRYTVDRLAQQMQQQMMASGQEVDVEVLRKQALEEIIMETLLIQDAQKQHFVAGKKLVDKIILTQPEFQIDGKFSSELFMQISLQLGYSPAQLRQLIADDIIVRQLQAGIMASAFVMPEEVNTLLSLENQKRDLQYIVFPANQFASNTEPTEAEIEEYYQNNITKWQTPERVSIEYIHLTRDDIAKQITITEEQISKAYEENKAVYSEPEEREVAHILLPLQDKAKAQEVYDRLSAGESFANLAKQFSTDESSAKEGGNLGWVTTGILPSELDEPVFSAKVNEIVGPVETPFGWDIAKVNAIKPEKIQPLAAVHHSVEEQLREQFIQNRFAELQNELATLSYEVPDSLTETASMLNLPLKTSALFSLNQGVDAVTQNPLVQAAAFSEMVLSGENSEIITIGPQDDIVLRVHQHEPSTTLSLDTVRDQVVSEIKVANAKRDATAKLREWIPQLNHKEIAAADVAKELNTSWKTVNQITRNTDSTKIPADVRDYGFALSLPESADRPSVGWKALSDDRFVIVQVMNVVPGNVPAEDSEEWKNTYLGLTVLQQQMDYTAYLEQLRENADVKYL